MFKFFLNLGKNTPNKLKKLNTCVKVTKSFARREISKGHIIAQNLTTSLNSNIINMPNQFTSQNKPPNFTLEQSNNFITQNILLPNTKLDSNTSKFFLEINQFLSNSGLLKNENFLKSLREISLNYSSNNENFYKSTLFKFLCLVDQIFNNRSLAYYNKADVTHFVFPHLIDIFTYNFTPLFEKDSAFLLKYNFLYFMSINKGEFSQALQVVFDHYASRNDNKAVNSLLNTKICLKEEHENLNKIMTNKKYFKFLDENVNTPSSDLIKDFTFKYNEKSTKEKLINDSVNNKKNYEKLKWIYNTLKSLQNFKIQPDVKLLQKLEVFLSTNFVEISEEIFGNEYNKFKELLNNSNKFLDAKLNPLTKLKSNEFIVKVSFDNLYDVFNPLFSGEPNLVIQFNKVADTFDELFALSLLRKYIENQMNLESYSFNDLYKLNVILAPVKFNSLEQIFKSVNFVTYDMNTINKIELNLRRKPTLSKLEMPEEYTKTVQVTGEERKEGKKEGKKEEKREKEIPKIMAAKQAETLSKKGEQIKTAGVSKREEERKAEKVKKEETKVEKEAAGKKKAVRGPKIKEAEKVLEAPKVETKIIETAKVEEKIMEAPKVETKIIETAKVEKKVVETPKVEEKVAEIPKVEEKVVETPKVKEKVVETPKVKEKVAEIPKVEEKVAKIPKVEEKVVEATQVEEKIMEAPSEAEKINEIPQENETVETPKVEEKEIEATKEAEMVAARLAAVAQKPAVILTQVETPKIAEKEIDALKVEEKVVEIPKIEEKVMEATKEAEIVVETPKVEEKVMEAPKVEEKVMEAPKIEEKVMEALKVEEKVVEIPKVEEKVMEAPKIEEKVMEAPKVEEKVMEALKVEEKVVEIPKVEEKVMEAPKIEEKVMEAPKVEEKVVEAPKIEEKVMDAPKVEEKVMDAPKVEEKIIEKPIAAEKVIEIPKVEEKVMEAPKVEEKIIETPKVAEKVVEVPKEVEKVIETPKVEEKMSKEAEKVIETPIKTEKLIKVPKVEKKVFEAPKEAEKVVETPKVTEKMIEIPKEADKVIEVHIAQTIKETPKPEINPLLSENFYPKTEISFESTQTAETPKEIPQLIVSSAQERIEEEPYIPPFLTKQKLRCCHTELTQKRDKAKNASFVKNPSKRFCDKNALSKDNTENISQPDSNFQENEEMPLPKFKVPPKEGSTSTKKPKAQFIVPKAEKKEAELEADFEEEQVLKKAKAKFVIPTKEDKKVEEEIKKQVKPVQKQTFIVPERKHEDIEEEDFEHEAEPLPKRKREEKPQPKFIVPAKEEVVVQAKVESKVSSTIQTGKAFELLKEKKKTAASKFEVAKSSEVEILEKLDNLTRDLQSFKSTNLFFSYQESNKEAIDLERATERYSLDYWVRKIYNEEYDEEFAAEEIERHIHTRMAKVFRKYQSDREKTLMVIYSLLNPALKSEFLLDLEYSFYQIFSNDETHSLFSKINLGHLGYQTLLSNCSLDTSKENRRNFEKIINHIEKSFYIPNNDNIALIMEICNKNYYPKYLKIIIDNYVLNKNVKLSIANYTKYVQLTSNFEELAEYSNNLINNSFTDFQIPVQVEFFEFILYKNLLQQDFYSAETLIKNLKTRYASDFPNEHERVKQMTRGMKFVFGVFNEYFENRKEVVDKMEKENKDRLYAIVNGVVTDVQFLDQKWKDDKEFTRKLINFYYDSSIEKYVSILEKFLAQNEFVTKSDFINTVELISKIGLSREKEKELKNKIVNVLDLFIEEYLRTGDFELTYEEKFRILREENLFKLYKFFSTLEQDSVQKMKTLQNLLKNIVDSLTFFRLPNKDKKFIQSHLMRIFDSNRTEALDFIKRIDILRERSKRDDRNKPKAELQATTEDTMIESADIEETTIEEETESGPQVNLI